MKIELMRSTAYELRRRCNLLASVAIGSEREMYLDAAEELDPGHGDLNEVVELPVPTRTANLKII